MSRQTERFQENYEHLILELDYDQHPLESEVRKVAGKYKNDCSKWMYCQIKPPLISHSTRISDLF